MKYKRERKKKGIMRWEKGMTRMKIKERETMVL